MQEMPICGREISMQFASSLPAQRTQYSYYNNFTLLNCGILLFAITIITPLTLGITKLPFVISCPVFVAGFISLFWLALQKDGKNVRPKRATINNFEDSASCYGKSANLEEKKREKYGTEYDVPFELVRANVRRTLSSYADYIDDATKNKLIDLCKKLEEMNKSH